MTHFNLQPLSQSINVLFCANYHKLLFSYVGRQPAKSIEPSSTYGRAKAAGFRAVLPHDCERSWVREDPNQPDSFREDSHFVQVGDGRPARHEIRQETKDRVGGT